MTVTTFTPFSIPRVLNLWVVVRCVMEYAKKAPKGSRRLNEVLKDAVDEMWRYVLESDGSDLLRCTIQEPYARFYRM